MKMQRTRDAVRQLSTVSGLIVVMSFIQGSLWKCQVPQESGCPQLSFIDPWKTAGPPKEMTVGVGARLRQE